MPVFARSFTLAKPAGDVPTWDCISRKGACNRLHQSCNVFVSESDAGRQYEIALPPARQAYVVCIEGALALNGTSLQQRDAAEVVGDATAPAPLSIVAGASGSQFMLIEMARP